VKRISYARPVLIVTAMWVIGLWMLYWMFVSVIRWPLELVVLLLLPILLTWIPVSYPLAIIGHRKSQKGEAVAFTWETIVQFFVVGILLVPASAGGAWLYMLTRRASNVGIVIAGLFELVCAMGILLCFRRILRGLSRENDLG
jgi:hypothetical protein